MSHAYCELTSFIPADAPMISIAPFTDGNGSRVGEHTGTNTLKWRLIVTIPTSDYLDFIWTCMYGTCGLTVCTMLLGAFILINANYFDVLEASVETELDADQSPTRVRLECPNPSEVCSLSTLCCTTQESRMMHSGDDTKGGSDLLKQLSNVEKTGVLKHLHYSTTSLMKRTTGRISNGIRLMVLIWVTLWVLW